MQAQESDDMEDDPDCSAIHAFCQIIASAEEENIRVDNEVHWIGVHPLYNALSEQGFNKDEVNQHMTDAAQLASSVQLATSIFNQLE